MNEINYTLHFLVVPKKLTNYILGNTVPLPINPAKQYKVLGVLEDIDEDIAAHFADKEDGGYKNYEDETHPFQSARASIRSACFATKIHLSLKGNQKIIVVAEHGV